MPDEIECRAKEDDDVEEKKEIFRRKLIRPHTFLESSTHSLEYVPRTHTTN